MDQECDNQNLKIGIIQEFTHMESENNAYLAYQKYIEEKYKINVTYETLEAEEILNWKANEVLPKEVDVFVSAIMINLMESRIGNKFKAFSFPIRFNPLLILSKPPTPHTASSMDFFNVDLYTALLILLSLLLVSAFWSVSRRLDISQSSKPKSKTSFLSTSLDNFWNSFIIFFFEPYTFIPETLSIRILTGVWLLGVLILSLGLSSVMRASFSFVTYDLVDTLKDLRNSKPIIPKIHKGSIEERLIYLKSVDNEDFRYVTDHVSEDMFLESGDLVDTDLYIQLKENEYFFNSYHTLLLLLGFLFGNELNIDNSIYISQPISEDYMVFPYGFNSSQCHKMKYVFEQVIMDIIETQWMKPVYLKDINLLEKMKWRIPDSETKAIQLQDLLSVYLLFCYGIALSCVVITIELLASVIKNRTRKPTLRRKRNLNILD